MFFDGKYQTLICPHRILASVLQDVYLCGRKQNLLPTEVFARHIVIHNSITDLPTNFHHLPVFPLIHSYTLRSAELPFLYNLGKTHLFHLLAQVSLYYVAKSLIFYVDCWSYAQS